MDKKVLSWRQFLQITCYLVFWIGSIYGTAHIGQSTPDWVRWSMGTMFGSMFLFVMLLPEGKKDAK